MFIQLLEKDDGVVYVDETPVTYDLMLSCSQELTDQQRKLGACNMHADSAQICTMQTTKKMLYVI